MKILLTLFVVAAVLRSMSPGALVLVLVGLVLLLGGIVLGLLARPAPKKKTRRPAHRASTTRRPTRPAHR